MKKEFEFPEYPMLPVELLQFLQEQGLREEKTPEQRTQSSSSETALPILLASAHAFIKLIQQQEYSQEKEQAQAQDQEQLQEHSQNEDQKQEQQQAFFDEEPFDEDQREATVVLIPVTGAPPYQQAQQSLHATCRDLLDVIQRKDPSIQPAFSTLKEIQQLEEKKHRVVSDRMAYQIEVVKFYELLQHYYLQHPGKITNIRQIWGIVDDSINIYNQFDGLHRSSHNGIKKKKYRLVVSTVNLLREIQERDNSFFMEDCAQTLLKYYEIVLYMVPDRHGGWFYDCAYLYFETKNYLKAQQWFIKVLTLSISFPQTLVVNYYLLLIADRLRNATNVICSAKLLLQPASRIHLPDKKINEIERLLQRWQSSLREPQEVYIQVAAVSAEAKGIPQAEVTLLQPVTVRAAAGEDTTQPALAATIATATVTAATTLTATTASAASILNYPGSLVRSSCDETTASLLLKQEARSQTEVAAVTNPSPPG